MSVLGNRGARSPLLTSKTPAQPREAPVVAPALVGPFPTLADLEHAIVDLGRAMKALADSRVKRDTIVLLLHDATGMGKKQIAHVLTALEQLESSYLKPRKAGGAGSG